MNVPTATKYTSGRLFHLARQAAERAETDPPNALSALLLSAIAFEAFFNDVIDMASFPWSDNEPWEIRAFAYLSEILAERHVPLDCRLETGFYVLTHKPLERGHQPFQDLQLLLELRNRLVHKRPESAPMPALGHTPEPSPHRLIERLVDRKVIPAPSGADAPFLLQYLEAPAVAHWAVKTAVAMAKGLVAAIPMSNTASTVRSVFWPVTNPGEVHGAI